MSAFSFTKLFSIKKRNHNKKINDNILRQESYLSTIISCMPGSVFWKDKNGVFQGCNDNLPKYLNLKSKNDVIGKTDYDFFTKTEADIFRKNDAEVLIHGKNISIEETVTMANGDVHTYLSNKVPLYNTEQTEIIGTLGLASNIFAQKKVEQALKKAKETEEEIRNLVMVLAGSIAHDLRTPLASMTILSQALRMKLESSATGKITELLDLFDKAASEMGQSIDLSLKSLQQVITGVQSTEDLMTCHLWACMEKVLLNYPFTKNEKSLGSVPKVLTISKSRLRSVPP